MFWIYVSELGTCPLCIMSRQPKLKPAGHTPIVERGFQSRGQVDLIDYQSAPDPIGDYKFLLTYVDHATKLTEARPLENKKAENIALACIDIFTVLGVPLILHTDNGSEFKQFDYDPYVLSVCISFLFY